MDQIAGKKGFSLFVVIVVVAVVVVLIEEDWLIRRITPRSQE
jgi:hypothetical protein